MTQVSNQAYYDAFSERYDRGRERGYHRLIDEQAAELVRRVGQGRDCLEVGCGTGLVLERVARFARHAEGIDLSEGMLQRARERGLRVRQGSAVELPYADASFDVAYSFKVLAHVPDVDRALAEMFRVVRPGGHLVFDVYNRQSLRWALKRLFGPRATSASFDEAAIVTRFESPEEALAHMPDGGRLVGEHGIRVITPHPVVHRIWGVRSVARRLEWALMDSPLWRFGGFVVYTVEKRR